MPTPPSPSPPSTPSHLTNTLHTASVNIGVRRSEDIRGRVIQAWTLDVVGYILEAWLVNKRFAVQPGSSATVMSRETHEQCLARRQAQVEQGQKEEAVELDRALHRQIA